MYESHGRGASLRAQDFEAPPLDSIVGIEELAEAVDSGSSMSSKSFREMGPVKAAFRNGPLPLTLHAASSATARVVIVGGGAGGYACAEWLSRCGFEGAVTVISDDIDAPYDRTVCSKQYLIGMTSRNSALLDGKLLGSSVLRWIHPPHQSILRSECRY